MGKNPWLQTDLEFGINALLEKSVEWKIGIGHLQTRLEYLGSKNNLTGTGLASLQTMHWALQMPFFLAWLFLPTVWICLCMCLCTYAWGINATVHLCPWRHSFTTTCSVKIYSLFECVGFALMSAHTVCGLHKVADVWVATSCAQDVYLKENSLIFSGKLTWCNIPMAILLGRRFYVCAWDVYTDNMADMHFSTCYRKFLKQMEAIKVYAQRIAFGMQLF